MRIDDLRTEVTDETATVSATVTWEDRDRAPMKLFYETDARFADHLTCDPHAFLVACLPPALSHGERRLAIDADICPELHDGLATAITLLQAWGGRDPGALRIETTSKTRMPRASVEPHAGSFLSGGVDSLATLRSNHLDYPSGHPRFIKTCLLADRFGADDGPAYVERVHASVGEIARDADVELIRVRTNVRKLDDGLGFWLNDFHGAALASVAHAFSSRFTSMTIASTFDVATMRPFGSHPVLDPTYGSAGLRIVHDGIRSSRLDKLRSIVDWPVAMQNLRQCPRDPVGLNCGRCFKCLLTMTEMLALGELENCTVFDTTDVTADALAAQSISNEYRLVTLIELIEPLAATGRRDLADAIRRLVAKYERSRAWEQPQGWRGVVRHVGARHLPKMARRIRKLDVTRDLVKAVR